MEDRKKQTNKNNKKTLKINKPKTTVHIPHSKIF